MDTAIESEDVGRRFCDLVMKGGITSGVVYPTAIARLSRQYRFRNIGGTSAGAIAAAATAAAEYRRATDNADPEYGFRELERLTALLGERPDGRHSRLFKLFQPERAARKHFAILEAMLNRETASIRVLRGVLATMGSFPIAAVAGALPGAVLFAASEGGGAPLHVFANVLAAVLVLLGAALAAATTAVVSLARMLPRQAFGLARGHSASQAGDAAEPTALTDWLHAYLQQVSGKDPDHPLMFGDLDAVMLDEDKAIKGIDLQMMTTALSMGRPFSLPFDSEQFYFERSELERFFPVHVVDAMAADPGPRSSANVIRDEAMASFGFLPFPTRSTLPVVVAVRMSLSFPVLLAAIPLYRYAWETSPGEAREDADPAPAVSTSSTSRAEIAQGSKARFVRSSVQRVLFSDGGICSNFPVQMFDSVLPAWPTFGINLRDDLPNASGTQQRAYLPDRGKSLPPEHYGIAEHGIGGVLSFATAIVKTMQNWRDNVQRAAPGFRDRIVTVRHTTNEGGLNLDMPARTIEAMAASGALAAQELIDAFGRPPTVGEDHLTYHRWVRIRSLLNVLQGMLREIHEGVTVLDNHPPYPELIRDAPGYVGESYRLSQLARDTAARLLDALDRMNHELDEARLDYSRTAPRPAVELRIQPLI